MQSSFIHMSTIVNFYFYHYFVPVKNPHVLLVNLICFKCTFSTDYHNLILRACFFFKKTRSCKKFLNPLNLFKQIIPRNHKHQKADLIFFIHFAFHGIHRKFLFRNFIKIMNTLFRVIQSYSFLFFVIFPHLLQNGLNEVILVFLPLLSKLLC